MLGGGGGGLLKCKIEDKSFSKSDRNAGEIDKGKRGRHDSKRRAEDRSGGIEEKLR